MPHYDSDMLRELEESLIALPAKADKHTLVNRFKVAGIGFWLEFPVTNSRPMRLRTVMAELEAAGRIPGNEPLL